jgi:type IV pilus assembly protein PilC
MPRYQWEGINAEGKLQRGTWEASSQEALRQHLIEQGIALLRYAVCKRSFLWLVITSRKTIATPDLIMFFEHLGMLLISGVDLVKALNSCAAQTSNKYFQKTIRRVLQEVLRGGTLAESIEHNIPNLEPHIIPLIVTGEQTGSLGIVCQSLGLHLSKYQELHKTIRQSLMLPGITLASAFFITLLVLLFVIPAFEELFITSHAKIPGSTKFLIAVSHNLSSQYILFAISSLILLVLLGMRFGRKTFKNAVNTFFSCIPLIKNFVVSCQLIRFFDLLALFLAAGFPLIEGLKRAQGALVESFIEKPVCQIVKALEQGCSFEKALNNNSKIFPPAVVALIGVGEKTGNLELMINKTVLLLEKQLNEKLSFLTTILGPAVMILLGMCIAALLVVLYLPIFNIAATPRW